MYVLEIKIIYDIWICFGIVIVDRRMNVVVDKYFFIMIMLNRIKVCLNEVFLFDS